MGRPAPPRAGQARRPRAKGGSPLQKQNATKQVSLDLTPPPPLPKSKPNHEPLLTSSPNPSQPPSPNPSQTPSASQVTTILIPISFFLQDNLLLYHHARLMAEKGRGSEREYLVGLMFSKFDTNNNGALDRDELVQVNKDCKQVNRD